MKNMIKSLICSSMLLGAASVYAAQTDITVTADIDPTVSMTMADGNPVPDSIKMAFKAGAGIQAYKNNIKLWSNSTDKDINVKLVQAPSLTDQSGANPIALDVTLSGTALTTTDTTLSYATLFPQGITNGSVLLPFVISQKDTSPAAIAKISAGQYSGTISIVVSQATTSA